MFSTVYICTFKVILTRVWQHHDVDYIHQIWKKKWFAIFHTCSNIKNSIHVYKKHDLYIWCLLISPRKGKLNTGTLNRISIEYFRSLSMMFACKPVYSAATMSLGIPSISVMKLTTHIIHVLLQIVMSLIWP